MATLALAVNTKAWPLNADGSQTAAADPAIADGLIEHVMGASGRWDGRLYSAMLGAANSFKEGDEIIGIAARNEEHRAEARRLLAATTLQDIDAHPPLNDGLHQALSEGVDKCVQSELAGWTLGTLKANLLEWDGAAIKTIMKGLSSDVIGCVVKLMSDEELSAVSAKVFNPLAGTNIGAKGYLGARIQPNSPTDHPDDIRWQVLNGWAYAVGDVLLGTNPVSSEPQKVHAIELVLKDLLATFGLESVIPHCVLAHIDVQAEVEERWPGSTALWFQSIAGSDAANATFDVTLDRLLAYADQRRGRYAFYFETGQGADFTNGHAQGMDMVLHESRKYGLARLLANRVADNRGAPPWLHVNDVAGFIGPEVFRSREQLVRCCLEDLVMGKLHGLCIGLDICSTLHMDVSLSDLDYCLDALAPAQPAYLMALPTKIDPMLGYLTTGFHDHVRLREKFNYRVDDRMERFFIELGVIDQEGSPTKHFGDPLWVYVQYMRRKGDTRATAQIREEGAGLMAAVRARGVFLSSGHGATRGDLPAALAREISDVYDDAKQSIWAQFDPVFYARMAGYTRLSSESGGREDYILHPATGEVLNQASLAAVRALRASREGRYNIQIVISDGLNALSIMDEQQREPFVTALREGLRSAGYQVAPMGLLINHGRVRAGYQIGETLFAGLPGPRAIMHIIGERPGTGHRTFSIYMTCPDGAVWSSSGSVDHNITKVVSGIANSALDPGEAARQAVEILNGMWA